MNNRLCTLLLAAAGLLATASAPAQDLILQVDRDSGNFTLIGGSSSAVNLAGYRIGSTNGTIDPNNFNGLRDTEPDWVLAGQALPTGVNELNSNGDPSAGTLITNATPFDLGNAYDPLPAIMNVGLGVDIEQNDLSLIYYDTTLNQTLNGVIEFVGDKSFNNLGITVDLADGTAVITNDSIFNLTITGYLIEAATPGTLNTNLATFNGLRDEPGGGSFEAPATLDGENLGELDPTGNGIAMNAGQSFSLGTVGGLFEDLTFTFLLAGTGETARTGFVTFLNVPMGLDGDYNEDGRVDAADYTVWRDNLGAAAGTLPNDPNASPIGQDQYNTWKDNFGAEEGVGALATAATVPEPGSVCLAMAGLAAVYMIGRKRFKN